MNHPLTAAEILILPARKGTRLIKASDTLALYYIASGEAGANAVVIVTAETSLEQKFADLGIPAYDSVVEANADIGDINVPYFDRSIQGQRLTTAYA